MTRITMKALHDRIGVTPSTPGYGSNFGPISRKKLNALLSNPTAPAATLDDFKAVADSLGIPVAIMRAVRKIESRYGAFDDHGRPSILYERHVFARNTEPKGKFNAAHPGLSATKGYGDGGYGKLSVQYSRLHDACALDPHAAFAACSWGAFQVLGEHADDLNYGTPLDMALALTTGERAHLDCFARFIRVNKLEDELRACKPGNAKSCVPFVSRYNGPGHAEFGYAPKLATSALEFTG